MKLHSSETNMAKRSTETAVLLFAANITVLVTEKYIKG